MSDNVNATANFNVQGLDIDIKLCEIYKYSINKIF